MEFLRQLDAFPKALDDFRVRTTSGAVVSLLSMTLMILLFISELRYYMRTEIVDHLIVNTTRSQKLRVGFDISFPQIACRLLAVDAIDDIGRPLVGIEYELFKHKLLKNGVDDLSFAEKHSMGDTIRTNSDLEALTKEMEAERLKDCGNCYGAGVDGQCCDTCEDVRKAYERLGWRFRTQDIAQCLRDAFLETERDKDTEEGGCRLYGHMVLNRASGHFHIAPHKVVHQGAMQTGLLSLRDLLSFTFDQFNITHTINSLTFGEPFPGISYPLDGQKRQLEDTHGMHQYYIKVVPTTYHKLGEKHAIESNQYSVTEHSRHLSPASDRGLPGVYFYYEISPVQASFHEKRGSMTRFITSVCAIVGGLFTVMGLVEKVVAWALKMRKAARFY